MQKIKLIISNIILKFTNYRIINNNFYNYLMDSVRASEFMKFASIFYPEEQIIQTFLNSKAQFFQDIFVLEKLNFKKNGFFVEFGAGDGVDSSNTFQLEKHFNWTGILIEPLKFEYEKLKNNRDCILDSRCIYNKSGEKVIFNERVMGIDDEYQNSIGPKSYFDSKSEIETITLTDLLDEYHAPKIIDYISIDTEGSEFKILEVFNFEKYKFKIIQVEHNFTNDREKIFKLLSSKGYLRVFTSISKVDDWYINPSLIN